MSLLNVGAAAAGAACSAVTVLPDHTTALASVASATTKYFFITSLPRRLDDDYGIAVPALLARAMAFTDGVRFGVRCNDKSSAATASAVRPASNRSSP